MIACHSQQLAAMQQYASGLLSREFLKSIKCLRTVFHSCMRECIAQPAFLFGRTPARANVLPVRTREATVVLALKWDVVAVGVVFLFVGAVLLGAF